MKVGTNCWWVVLTPNFKVKHETRKGVGEISGFYPTQSLQIFNDKILLGVMSN